jgi:hypothetical protein
VSHPSTTNLEQRLARYGLMSLAALTALAAPASAAVRVFSPAGGALTTPSSCGGEGTSYVYFQMTSNKAVAGCTHGAPGSFAPDFDLRNDANQSVSLLASGVNGYMGAVSHSGNTKVAELNAGALVSAGKSWGASQTLLSSGGTTYYGWVNITVNSYKSVTLNQWGYEDNASSIAAGETSDGTSPTPLPNSLLLLAAGCAGLAAYRKLRAHAQA